MNIFEEIRESYIYNGVVSLKALEDDIVTLENQIDSFKATLKELVVRGKKTDRITEKIRETQMKLNMLKAVHRKETDSNVTNDEMLNVLGVSGKSAKGIDKIETAADNKKPFPQDFQEAEVEKISENKDIEVVGTENEGNRPEFCTYKSDDGNGCNGECNTCVWNSKLEKEVEERENGVTPVSIDDYVESNIVIGEEDDSYDTEALNMFNDDECIESDPEQEKVEENYKYVPRIYTTFFFNGLDGKETTEYVQVYHDNKKLMIDLAFERVADYDFYVEALMERNQSFFKRLLKKPRTIFMNVHKIECDKEIVYHYEFVGCRVLEVSDSSYMARTGTGWDYDDLHECHIRFKYKKLKLSVE